ncbi:hypothetical protein R84B8_01213 [Treponema sp. R8-4-B8]
MKKKSTVIFLFFVFAILSPWQGFAQTIPARLDVPVWVKMGMSVAQVRGQVPGNVLIPRPDTKDQYVYKTAADDIHILTIRSEKGLTAFQYGIDYNVKTAIQLFTKVYGEPIVQNDENVIWLLVGNSRKIMFIKISIDNSNYNFLNTQFFFTNEFDD